MNFTTNINGVEVTIPVGLVEKYDRPLPRYTSYPTVPAWEREFDGNKFLASLEMLKETAALSMYIHIPFCPIGCNFCGCNAIVSSNKRAIANYVDCVTQEIVFISGRLKKGYAVRNIHFGGGSPNTLSNNQIQQLLETIQSRVKIAGDTEIGIEADPRSTTRGQIESWARLGVNRLSLGLQDTNSDVLSAIGRLQSIDMVQDLIDTARQCRYKSINLDLVYGLPHQTPKSIKKTVEDVLRLNPDRAALFNFAYLPVAKPHQRRISKGALPKAREKFEIFCNAIGQMCSGGYNFIGLDHFARQDDAMAIAARENRLSRNFQGYTPEDNLITIAFGVTAISTTEDVHAQNCQRLSEYQRAVANGRSAIVRGLKLSSEDRLRQRIIRDLFCNGLVIKSGVHVCHCEETESTKQSPADNGLMEIASRPKAARNDTLEFDQHFGDELTRLKEFEGDGLITLGEDVIQVTPRGRLFIRNIGATFDQYLAKNPAGFSRSV